jgi:hypothetical protein
MKDAMRNESGVPAVVDRSTFQAELDALRVLRRLAQEKATRLQPPAGGCQWSKWIARYRLSASAAL